MQKMERPAKLITNPVIISYSKVPSDHQSTAAGKNGEIEKVIRDCSGGEEIMEISKDEIEKHPNKPKYRDNHNKPRDLNNPNDPKA
jgi:hypothetical protein